MDYQIVKKTSIDTSECFVFGFFDEQVLPEWARSLSNEQLGLVERLSKKLNDHGDYLWQMDIDGHSLLLIHCGKEKEYTPERLQKNLIQATKELKKYSFSEALIALPTLEQYSPSWHVEQMVTIIESECYQFQNFKSKPSAPCKLSSISLFLPKAEQSYIKKAQALSSGIILCKQLADTPANTCTPTYLAHQALSLEEKYSSLATKVIEKKEMEQLGMGALLAVAKGSIEPPKLIEITYEGTKSGADPIVLVGKGITFDSGGLTLKPGEALTEMKYDMSGAASVLGTLKACAQMELPVNVIGLIACAENMPSGHAVKPGDVVSSMSGQTIEILNTDAEGRLVLADALTYAERYQPKFVIDIATLTGAIIVSLGSEYTGFMTPDDKLALDIVEASQNCGDKAWRLPLDKAYQKALESPIADMINSGFERAAGSIVAASFLSRFTQSYPWAHLDIAGSAWISGKNRHATGRPVSLLIEMLRHAAKS